MTTDMAWVISAKMGLGHQRATYPLKEIAAGKVLLFGEDFVESKNERRLWRLFQESYEFISRTRQVPLIGPSLFSLLEKLQNISPYYPFRDQSRPSFQVKSLYSMVKRGLGRGLCSRISSGKMPVVTSFYASAIAAEELTDLPVYCIICDADINRVWVAENPRKSRITYLAPCGRAMRRLKEYGVPDDRIFLTGFPLPKENVGDIEMSILKDDLCKRLNRLDPTGRFRIIHGEEAKLYLGSHWTQTEQTQPLTVTYAVGGAGAQAEIARDVINSFAPQIRSGKVRLNLVAGVRSKIAAFFRKVVEKAGLTGNERVYILYHPNEDDYFKDFNRILRNTDVLWTKPSELTFYCGLGIPIITAPCIGPHEVYNRLWLHDLGAGIPQSDPRYCGEWIMDYMVDGHLAQSAWNGFLYARKIGTYKIEEVLNTGAMSREVSPVKR